LLSKVGYDEIPLLSIEKLKKLCPFDKKKNQKNIKTKNTNSYYSIALKMLRLEYYGGLTEELTDNFMKSLHQKYHNMNKQRNKFSEKNIENRILEQLNGLT
ncbi:hypothetical protein CDIK_4195, partial [Cucumispora dikerogammari]